MLAERGQTNTGRRTTGITDDAVTVTRDNLPVENGYVNRYAIKAVLASRTSSDKMKEKEEKNETTHLSEIKNFLPSYRTHVGMHGMI